MKGDSLIYSRTYGIFDYIAVRIPLHTNFLNSKSSLLVQKKAFN